MAKTGRTLGRALLAALLVGCAPAASGDAPRVLVAASAADAIERVAPGARVGVAASSALARQILSGAPADAFVSASRAWIDAVVAARDAAGEPVVVARNALVVIAPRGRAPAGTVGDPRALAAWLDGDARLALADEGVPAGEYARQALVAHGLFDDLAARIVGQADVRGVLAAVAGGHVDAGVVYRTDAAASDEVVALFTFDAAAHDPIELVAVALTPRGVAFVDELSGPSARAVLAELGFEVPTP